MKWTASTPCQVRLTVLRRYAQFCVVGGSGVFVDMAVIWLLADPANLGWDLTLSKVLAAETAIVNNFVWNDVWTFGGLAAVTGGWRARAIRFGKFNLICLAGIAWSVLLLQVQVTWLSMDVYLANLVSIIAVSVWNFAMNLRFGWKSDPRKGDRR
ncbi:MAG: GtrA family protein [Verrucomicrobiales bacterium]|nr:GtrA family protein [Verrucomicrobiales bacterium]